VPPKSTLGPITQANLTKEEISLLALRWRRW